MRRFVQLASGLLLLCVSVCGIWFGVRAAIGQALYFQAKYGSLHSDNDVALDTCERAYRMYPHSYYMCLRAGWTAYRTRRGANGADRPERIELAGRWCRRGLALNQRKRHLLLLDTQIRALSSVDDAIDAWKNYIEWHFWHPANHVELIKLYIRAGDYEGAEESLKWVKGSRYFDKTRKQLQEAGKKNSGS